MSPICKQCKGYKKSNVGEVCYSCRSKNTSERRRKKMEEMDKTTDDKKNYKLLRTFYIAGVQHHQGMKEVSKDLKEGQQLTLVLEPSNKFDPNAVRVEAVKMNGESAMLGYVPKLFSAEISGAFSIGKSLECVLVKYTPSAKPWEMAKVEVREVE